MILVFAENDIDPILELLIHDKKMNTALFNLPNRGIGKIKINQSVENELILKLLMIINLNYFLVKRIDYVYIIFYICYNEKSKTREL
jgi:hypothetical protein